MIDSRLPYSLVSSDPHIFSLSLDPFDIVQGSRSDSDSSTIQSVRLYVVFIENIL